MTTEKKYQKPDPPHPGESLDSYLRRFRAHPEDQNPKGASEQDMEQFDQTDLYKDQAFSITKK